MPCFPFSEAHPGQVPLPVMRMAAALGANVMVSVDPTDPPVQVFRTGARISILLVNPAQSWLTEALDLLEAELMAKPRLVPSMFLTRRPAGQVAEVERLGFWLTALTYAGN